MYVANNTFNPLVLDNPILLDLFPGECRCGVSVVNLKDLGAQPLKNVAENGSVNNSASLNFTLPYSHSF